MTEPDFLGDIIDDISTAPVRPQGNPCRIAVMRRERPELEPQFWRAVERLKAGDWYRPDGRRTSDNDVAEWFNRQKFAVDRLIVQRHRAGREKCQWCRQGLSA